MKRGGGNEDKNLEQYKFQSPEERKEYEESFETLPQKEMDTDLSGKGEGENMEGPSTIEAAKISKDVYEESNVARKGGWEKVNPEIEGVKYKDESTGFNSALYARENKNGQKEYVYAFAGTKMKSLEDWEQNAKQLTGNSEQYKRAVKNARELKDELGGNVTFVGHSLGGGLASAAAKATGRDAITFNAAGLSPMTKKEHNLKFGQTLLEWAVYTNRFKAAKALAEMGGNPNIQSYNGTSAFIHAADKLNTSKYLRLLLNYDGNVNAVADTTKKQPERTPLIAAAKSRLESVRLLVEAGANINYDFNGYCALEAAAVQDKIKIVKYLIKQGAEFKEPLLTTLDGEKRYLHHLLRSMVFEIGSEKYKTKMWVVDTLQDHGMNYWKTEVPEHLKENYSKEYLKKY